MKGPSCVLVRLFPINSNINNVKLDFLNSQTSIVTIKRFVVHLDACTAVSWAMAIFPADRKRWAYTHTHTDTLRFVFSLPFWHRLQPPLVRRLFLTNRIHQNRSTVLPVVDHILLFTPARHHIFIYFFRIELVCLFMWLIIDHADVPVRWHNCQFFSFLSASWWMELHVFVTHTAAEHSIMGWRLVRLQMWRERNSLLASRRWLDFPCEKV